MAQDDYIIQNIRFEGNETLSSSVLKRELTLEAKSLRQQFFFWEKPEIFNDGFVEHDLRRLIILYQKEGFLNAQIQFTKIPKRKKDHVKIIFLITENAPVTTGKIRYILQNTTAEERQQIDSLIRNLGIPLQEEKRFRDADVHSGRNALIKLLLNHGYPVPDIQYRISLKEESKKADVDFLINPGSKSRLGDIRVSGNEHIDTEMIHRQLTLKTGDLYDQSDLEKNQRLVQQLGVFEFVSIRNILRERDPVSGTLPIEIFVRELPRWSVKTGAGYGLDEKIRLTASFRKQPFFGKARYATLYLKYSYLEPYHVQLKITRPAFLTPSGSLVYNPFIRKEHEKAYDLERYGIGFMFQYALSAQTQTFINYTFERNYLDLSKDVSEALILTDTYYNKSGVSWGISRDNSSPIFFPNKGYFASIVTTFSGLPGSRYHYLSALTDVRKYQKLSQRLVLAARLKAGSMMPVMGDDITPIEERFYAGGAKSVRGVLRNDLSPKNENDISVGGNSYLELSFEMRQEITNNLYGVLFVDCGNVWKEYLDHNPADLVYTPGTGIRFRTPIGPIRFDVAYPINMENAGVRFHLSFGQAF
jgi:outer membrane protein insertion porin family